MSFMEEMHKAAAVYGIELTERQFEQFNCYFELLIEWNEKMNLTAITEPREVAVKHMVDSLSAYDAKIFQGEKSLIDVGTGAGFPGLPLKIFHPELSLTLLDSLNKRVKFLQTIVDALGLTNVCCVHARAEEAARQKIYRESFDIAVSRAVARMPILAEYCLPFVRRGGYFLALKGMKYEEEAQEVKPVLRLLGGNSMHIRPVTLPGLSDVRAVIYIKKEKTTSLAYPRKAGMPEKNPLGKIEKKDFAPQGRNNKQSGK
jgi:16S rRNA (guanine527-N7)-methyltransferase